MRNLARRVCWLFLFFAFVVAGTANGATTTFISNSATWRYLDNGSNQGTGWRSISFDDSNWRSGSAQLGYGDGDESTIVRYGSNSSYKHITTYFRRKFNVNDKSKFSGLTLKVLRDDGAVVYLNGNEVFRTNMPTGTVTYTTKASSAVGGSDEDRYYQAAVSPSRLINGTNVIAVEVHQSSRSSTDLSFNLQFTGSDGSTGTTSASVTRGPYLQMGTSSSVIVRWRTNTATNSRVRYGTSSSSLDRVADNSTSTTEHSVKLSGLSSNTKYYYSIGSTTKVQASGSSYYFYTSPSTGSSQAMRIWVLGDSGTASSNAKAVRDAYYSYTGSKHTNLWLMLGDNAYSNGTDSEYQRAVFDIYPGMLRKSVLWSTLGNHDTGQTSSPSSSIPYYSIFNLPTSGEAGGVKSGTEDYYSFNVGNVHFICLDSMTSDRSKSGPMLTWLKNDLAANSSMWKIAFWHHPPYSKGSHDSDAETRERQMRENALPILEDYGVDLVLAGHSHSYERSYLIDGHYGYSWTLSGNMIKNKGSGRDSNPYRKDIGKAHDGAVYVVAGSSGKTESAPLNHPVMYISLLKLGSVILDVNGKRLDVKFLRETKSIADYFTIVKE